MQFEIFLKTIFHSTNLFLVFALLFKEFASDFWCVTQIDKELDSSQAAWGYCTGKCPQNCNEDSYVFIIVFFYMLPTKLFQTFKISRSKYKTSSTDKSGSQGYSGIIQSCPEDTSTTTGTLSLIINRVF